MVSANKQLHDYEYKLQESERSSEYEIRNLKLAKQELTTYSSRNEELSKALKTANENFKDRDSRVGRLSKEIEEMKDRVKATEEKLYNEKS